MMKQAKSKDYKFQEVRNQQENLMPEAFIPGHEVVCWQDGQPVWGYIGGVEVDYRDCPRKAQ